MKAIVLTTPGGIENLQMTDLPIPEPSAHEVVVEVKAIGINPVDAFVRWNEGYLQHVLKLKEGESPVILGWDISGIVTQTGKDVTRFKAGDEVFGMVNFEGHGKAYAQYVAAPEGHLALKPGNISHAEAAAATLAALTAWQSLVTYAKIKAGDKVLIHAAAGGVGHYAVQIAKHFGACVIGTSTAANRDFILHLGADEHIDYTKERFEDRVKDATIVLDSLGIPGHLNRSLDALKPGGRLISLLTFFTDESLINQATAKQVFTHRLGVRSNGEDMQAIAGLLQNGKLRSTVSQTFRFEELPQAHEKVASGHTTGKLVITL